MDLRLTDEQELLRRSVREFAESEIKPHVREWDEAQHFPDELLSKLADLGLMGIQFAPEYGGSGMSAVDYCICIEELARVDPSVSLSIAAHNGLGAAHISMFGTAEQKQRYLTPLARGYAFQRKQFGRPIGTFQSIRWKLVDNATRIEAARLLTYRAAWLKDQGRRMTLESSMAKLYSSEIAVRASEDSVQIHGGYGFVKDYPAEKFFRDVKLTTIGEGTSEVQRLVIARQLLAQAAAPSSSRQHRDPQRAQA